MFYLVLLLSSSLYYTIDMLYSIKNARSTFEYKKKTDSKFSEKLHIVGFATFDFACLDAVSWVLVCIKYNKDELEDKISLSHKRAIR